MKPVMEWLVTAHSLLLNFYPSAFREEFASEMQTVFRESVLDADRKGVLALSAVCIRELVHLPISVLREFWHEIRGKEILMEITQTVPFKQGAWGDAVWAGLPHLLIALMALGAALSEFVAGANLTTSVAQLVLLLLLVGLLATIYYTWRNHWPAWTASWYGYVAFILLLFSVLPAQGWAEPAVGIFSLVRLILLPLGLTALYYWMSRRNPIEALLMAMPLIIVYWLPVMEFVPRHIQSWLTFGIFLISALSAIAITRLNTIHNAVWIMLGASMLGGLPISYARTFWGLTAYGRPNPGNFKDLIETFSVPWLASSALVLGPILGWGIWNLGKRYGRGGRLAAGLIIAGTLINLWGQFRYWQWYDHQYFFPALNLFPFLIAPGRVLPSLTIAAGLYATLIGTVLLAKHTWANSKPLSIFMILLPLVLPLFAMFPIYFGFHIIPAGLSFEFGHLGGTYKLLIFIAGAALVAASGWSITRLHNPTLHEGTSWTT